MLEVCPKCKGMRPVGTFHCEIEEWEWTLPPNKKAEDKARVAWRRGKGKRPNTLHEINKIYNDCPPNARVVHTARAHVPENLTYELQ